MLRVHNLTVNYRGLQALQGVNFTLEPGELVGLIGPNGAGKSTLLKAILGLLPPQGGQVFWRGMPLRRCARSMAYVPQRSQIDWDYPITAGTMVRLGNPGWFRCDRSGQERARLAMERLEVWHLRDRQIGELSGGQQQRLILARALTQEAQLLLLDEPLTAVDKKTEGLLLSLFQDLKRQGKSLLICSHEWGEALRRYDRLLLLNRHVLADDRPEQVLTFQNIQRAYGECCHPHWGLPLGDRDVTRDLNLSHFNTLEALKTPCQGLTPAEIRPQN